MFNQEQGSNGIVRCLACENCSCVEITHQGRRLRVAEIVRPRVDNIYYVDEQTNISECKNTTGTEPLFIAGEIGEEIDATEDIKATGSSNNPLAITLFLSAMNELTAAYSPTLEIDPDDDLGVKSEKHIYGILISPELCPWVADAFISKANSAEDQDGIDVTVLVSRDLAKLIKSDYLHIQVKTNLHATTDFYKTARAITRPKDGTTPPKSPNLQATAQRWQDLRLIMIGAGAGERSADQIVFEIVQQIKRHVAIQNPAMSETEIQSECARVTPEPKLEARSRFSRSPVVQQEVYERDLGAVFLLLQAIEQDSKGLGGEAWSQLKLYLQNHSGETRKQDAKRAAKRAKIEKQKAEQPKYIGSRKGDSRNSDRYNARRARYNAV